MAEPIYASVITRGIMDRLYFLQKIKNFYRAGKKAREAKSCGYDLLLTNGLLMEQV